MSDLISMDKQYRTHGDLPVRILSIDLKNSFLPVVGAVLNQGIEKIVQFTSRGFSSEGSHFDLIEVKTRIKQDAWVNVYSGGHLSEMHPTKKDADQFANKTRIACVKVEIDCEQGEGLDQA